MQSYLAPFFFQYRTFIVLKDCSFSYTLIFWWQVSHLSWLEKKTATALSESPLGATVQDALSSFLKVSGREGKGRVDSSQKGQGDLVFPKDISVLGGVSGRGQIYVCLFYGK